MGNFSSSSSSVQVAEYSTDAVERLRQPARIVQADGTTRNVYTLVSKTIAMAEKYVQDAPAEHDDNPPAAKELAAALFLTRTILAYAVENLPTEKLEEILQGEESSTSTADESLDGNLAKPLMWSVLRILSDSPCRSGYSQCVYVESLSLTLTLTSTPMFHVLESTLKNFLSSVHIDDEEGEQDIFSAVGSAAKHLLTLPFTLLSGIIGSSSRSSQAGKLSLLVLLTLVHHRNSANEENVFATRLRHLCDTQHTDADDAETRLNAPGSNFHDLFDALSKRMADESVTLLMYTLLHTSQAFLQYVLSREDVEVLVLPMLKVLYHAEDARPYQIYMVLISMLILTQDASFCASVHMKPLPHVLWFRERILTAISLGSLIVVLLVRTVQFNFSKLRDIYLHTNCLAALTNMSPHFTDLHPYAAQRIITLVDMLKRKYVLLVHKDKSTVTAELKGTESLPNAPTDPGVSEELEIYTDLLRIVLETVNACLTYALPRNPYLVYQLLYRRELFEPFRTHHRFWDLVDNITRVIEFFAVQLDLQSNANASQWDAPTVVARVTDIAELWSADQLRVFPELKFTYEEEAPHREFFLPYVMELIHRKGLLGFRNERIILFETKKKSGDENEENDSDVEETAETASKPHEDPSSSTQHASTDVEGGGETASV